MKSLGPRNQRRVATSATAIAVLGAIVAAVLVTRSSTKPTAASSARSTTTAPGSLGKAGTYPTFGMTPKQVRQITGPPTSTRGGCWVFRPKPGDENGLPTRSIGTMSLGDPGSIAARSNGLVKLCFYEGTFSTASRQIEFNGQLVWRDFSPGGPVTSTCDPCTPP
ncbi:MAG TPA: hypothetical protein VLJ44_04650 [Gaiellaceae bacterium]|nr:hypothetical protein [Gaiellaceae bacterium]